MMRERLSYANVMATLALFVALGGVGYAAAKLPRNSVGPKQIKADAVKPSELAPNSVDGSNVVDGSIAGAEIADESIAHADIGQEEVGGDEIADGSIGGGDIANGSLGGDDINDGSIGGVELADASVTRAKLAPVDLKSPTLDECSPGTPWQAVPGLPPHYWKDNEGVVHLEGAVQCSVNITGASIFQIPRVVGEIYDPAGTKDVVRWAALASGLSLAQIAVVENTFTTGVVYDGGTAANSENYVSLEGLTYRSE